MDLIMYYKIYIKLYETAKLRLFCNFSPVKNNKFENIFPNSMYIKSYFSIFVANL